MDFVNRKAAAILEWIVLNPEEKNINSEELIEIVIDVLINPCDESRKTLTEIWESRKKNAANICLATSESAYSTLIEELVYAEEIPRGVAINREYIEKVFVLNAYARLAEYEKREIVFDNLSEYDELLQMRAPASLTLDSKIFNITDLMVRELETAIKENRFENKNAI